MVGCLLLLDREVDLLKNLLYLKAYLLLFDSYDWFLSIDIFINNVLLAPAPLTTTYAQDK